MNKQPMQPEQMQIKVDMSNKKPFRCDNVLNNGQTCNNEFFIQYFQLFYVSPIEAGTPQPMTVPRQVWVCVNCKKGFFGAKPDKKEL